MRLYHSTGAEAAASIRADGFVGASGSFMFPGAWFEDVVFFASVPAGEQEGLGKVVLEVETGDDDLSDYAIVEEDDPRDWREYMVPADVARRWRIVSVKSRPSPRVP